MLVCYRLFLVLVILSTWGCVGPQAGDLVSGFSEGSLPPPSSGVPKWPNTKSRNFATDVLIYGGAGAATSDLTSIIDIISAHGMSYDAVSSGELNEMSIEDLRSYGVLIWPGGKAKTMSDSLAYETRIKIRNAIVADGVSFVGFCAGTFIAGTYDWSPTWGLELVNIDFPYYYLQDQGTDRAMVDVTFPDGSSRSLLWYGGPELANFGRAVAKYPDGTSAIAQDWLGNGFVILSGPHPEAPVGWKSGYYDSDGSDYEYAWTMIEAAIQQKSLPVF
jgi:glutamine amidotransferase-like uncharacterized protein